MFKIGQKLVCVKDNEMFDPHPVLNEVYVYHGTWDEDSTFIHVAEFKEICLTKFGYCRRAFAAHCFRPLLGDSAKDSLIQSFTEVTETSDLPVRQPETA